jgi:hypothetical protein
VDQWSHSTQAATSSLGEQLQQALYRAEMENGRFPFGAGDEDEEEEFEEDEDTDFEEEDDEGK